MQLLEKHFDEAFTTPNGVEKLRDLILTLAMQGKLVKQDSKELSATELMKSITLDKQQLIAEEKIKKSKPLPEIEEKEIPYELPSGWIWARFGDLVQVLNGRAYKKNELLDSGTPVLRVGNLFTSKKWYYSDLSLEENKYIENGDLIYSWSASFGPFIWNGEKVIYHYHIWKLDFFSDSTPMKEYLYNYLLEATGRIKGAGNGIAMIHMTKTLMEKLLVPLPPLSEQHRIVAKIDQLMARCGEIEKSLAERDRKQITVHTAALNRLLTAPDTDTFTQSWQFITQHFSELYSVKENVTELRKAILQLAVMGKLVPQDPEDKSAIKLLESVIKQTRKRRGTKRDTVQSTAVQSTDDAKSLSLQFPRNWQRATVKQLTTKLGSGSTPRGGKNAYVSLGIPFLRSQNVWNDGLRMDNVAFIPEETHEKMASTKVMPMDILLNITGASLGRCALVPDDFKEANVSQHVMIVRSANKDMRDFLHLLLISPYCQEKIWTQQVGMSREGLSKKVFEQFELPVPPLSEQRRIVDKTNQLMSLCDQLEQQIDNATQKQTALLNAVIAQI